MYSSLLLTHVPYENNVNFSVFRYFDRFLFGYFNNQFFVLIIISLEIKYNNRINAKKAIKSQYKCNLSRTEFNRTYTTVPKKYSSF